MIRRCSTASRADERVEAVLEPDLLVEPWLRSGGLGDQAGLVVGAAEAAEVVDLVGAAGMGAGCNGNPCELERR